MTKRTTLVPKLRLGTQVREALLRESDAVGQPVTAKQSLAGLRSQAELGNEVVGNALMGASVDAIPAHFAGIGLVRRLDARAYIEAPMTLGDVINQSSMITILRVKSVDKSKNLIVYDRVEDIRGKFPTAIVRHVITGQLREGEIKAVLDWAEPGKTAIFFAKDGACETCIDNYWYQIYKNGEDLYGMSHGEPFLLRSYAGKADRLPAIVRGILEGREVIVRPWRTTRSYCTSAPARSCG